MNPVAFVCAMPMELAPLTRRLGLRRTALAGLRARTGELDGEPVVAIASGMGTALAEQAARRLLDAVTPRLVLVTGIAGAVDDDTPIGALLHPARVLDHATGREHHHRPVLATEAEATGALWTTDAITSAAELPALRARGVVGLDMETSAVAAACEARGVPWTVVRAVSDRATDGTVDEEVFRLSRQDGTPDLRAVARYVLRHPGRVPALARNGRGARLAARRAADAAVAAARLSRRGP